METHFGLNQQFFLPVEELLTDKYFLMSVQLEYPVFAFDKGDNMIYVFYLENKLKSTSTKILKELGYNNITIIDSSGKVYKIKNAFKVKYKIFFGFSLLKKGRQILIDFEYYPEINTITLEDFKKDIILRVNKTKRIWESAWDIKELIEEINKASSFSEIAMFLK